MKKSLVLLSFFVLAIAPATRAAQNAVAVEGSKVAAVPVVDAFEDGDQRLRLIALPSSDGAAVRVTLVYEDAELQALRSVTVDPEVVTSTKDAAFTAFLDEMDPGFLSYVRASLADRLLHLRTAPSSLDRAESALFFPNAVRDGRVAHTRGIEETRGAE